MFFFPKNWEAVINISWLKNEQVKVCFFTLESPYQYFCCNLRHHVMPYMYSEMQNKLSKIRESPLESMGQVTSSRCPAARFVTRNYSYETGSMTGILEELKWETLQKRRKDNRLILIYKGLKGKARIPTYDLIPKNRRCRYQHSIVFQIPSASKDSYKKSFFPQTIRD